MMKPKCLDVASLSCLSLPKVILRTADASAAAAAADNRKRPPGLRHVGSNAFLA